jgi:hypothetical protein
MSGQEDPYSRVYWRVKDDERFEHAYSCDTCWAAYVRLLMDAEAAYPASATMPASLKRHARVQLVADGIVELRPHDCYVIHGLQAERERRSEAARSSAEARWYGAPAMRTHSDGNAASMLTEPSLDEPIRTEPSRAPETGPDVWQWVTLRYPNKRTNPNLWVWLERLAEDFGVDALWEVMRDEYLRDQNKGTLLSRTEAVLARRIDVREREAERQRLAEARKPVVLQPVKELSDEEASRQADEWKAAHR